MLEVRCHFHRWEIETHEVLIKVVKILYELRRPEDF